MTSRALEDRRGKSCGHRDEGTNRRGCMQRICIFCGSQVGTNGLYRQAATALGQLLVRHGYGLVYGGGHVGLMGVIADAVLASGGGGVRGVPGTLVGPRNPPPGAAPVKGGFRK